MGKVEKNSSSRTSSKTIAKQPAIQCELLKQTNDIALKRTAQGSNSIEAETSIDDSTQTHAVHDTWTTVQSGRSKKMQKTQQNVASSPLTFFGLPIPQNTTNGQVHSYFASDETTVRPKPTFNRFANDPLSETTKPANKITSSKQISDRRRFSKLPPFKLEFENRQKPAEILVLNELVKHDNHLNVNTARYSTHDQSRHILLLFANDSSSYELLFQSTSWPSRICGLTFKVTSPHRTPTSYSILVNRVPREWNVESIKPLISQRYSSVLQVARIFHDRQPINRIRVDFQSTDDVQMILQCQHILIDSVRYPAASYKPLTRIDRCFRCQQFGHKAMNCTHESKCFKCGEAHEYNRNCSNPIKCANCSESHMAGSPECSVKISYRRTQRQQVENTVPYQRPSTPPFLSSPSRLYSTVLQAAPSPLLPQKQSPESSDRSTFIVDTIKNEILRSQEILLDRIVQLSENYDRVNEQIRTMNWTTETQIVPFISTIAEVVVNVCDQLHKTKKISLNDQQQAKLQRLRSPPAISTSSNSFTSNQSMEVFSDALKSMSQSSIPRMQSGQFSSSIFNSFSSQ